jgi:hypothetical protein
LLDLILFGGAERQAPVCRRFLGERADRYARHLFAVP